MEKNKLHLQLFAEMAEPENNPAEDQPAPDESAKQAGTGNEQPADEGKNSRTAPKYSDEDLDAIIGRRLAAWQKQQEKKTTEAERLGRMSEAERANERIRVLEERLAESDRRENIAAMTRTARTMLQAEGINLGDELLSHLVSESAEDTKASINSFVTAFKAEVEKAVKERVKGEVPKTGTTTGITREQILAVQNRAERQRLMQENAHLF